MPRNSIYELVEYLPGTNCGKCGMDCMKFAGLLLSRDGECDPAGDGQDTILRHSYKVSDPQWGSRDAPISADS